MSDVFSRSGHFEPIHEAHAIEQVVFVLQIDRSLDDVSFSEARKVAEQFKQELPGQAEIQGLTFAIAFPGPIPPSPTVGTVFHRIGPDGALENELRVERTSVTFRTSLYTRWDAVWSQASKYLAIMHLTISV